MMTTKYTANPCGNSNSRLNIVINNAKGNACPRILFVIVFVLGICLVVSLIVNGWLGHKIMVSTTHLDEHHDIFKEREAKFHSRIVNLKENVDHLQIIHHNLLHASLQKEMEYNNTIFRLNQDIKLLEEDYNELLAIYKQKEKEFNQTVALYEVKKRQWNQTISLYIQRELESNQTIDVCQQNVQNLTDTVEQRNQSMQKLRREINLTVASCEEKQLQCNQTISLCIERELENKQTIDVCHQNVQSLMDTVDKQNQIMQKLRQEIKVASSGFIVTATTSLCPIAFVVLLLLSVKSSYF